MKWYLMKGVLLREVQNILQNEDREFMDLEFAELDERNV